jgi:hypothetical protein
MRAGPRRPTAMDQNRAGFSWDAHWMYLKGRDQNWGVVAMVERIEAERGADELVGVSKVRAVFRGVLHAQLSW